MPEVTPSRDLLLRCLSVPRWAADVLAGRPYDDRSSLLKAADLAARHLSEEELAQALSGHARIGEQGSAQSQTEQAHIDPTRAGAAVRLAQGNAAYEERFNRVFLIRASGRNADEILEELDRRLCNDDVTEREETVDNLREIALLRLEQAL